MGNIKMAVVKCECGDVQIQFFEGANVINLLVPKGFTHMNEYPEVSDTVTNYIMENLDENHMHYAIGVFKFEGSYDTKVAYDAPIPVGDDGRSFIVEREAKEDGRQLN